MFDRNFRPLRAEVGNPADKLGHRLGLEITWDSQYKSSKILNISAGLPIKIGDQIKKNGQNQTLFLYKTKTCKERALQY